MGSLRVGSREITTSNEDKVFFPSDGVTKGDLIAYYLEVAPAMLPHLRNRPLSFQRFPNGIEREGFFQKDAPKHYPEWISTVGVRKKGGANRHVVVESAAALAYLANNGVVTIHGALSVAPRIDRPDRMVFDLDPSVEDFSLVVHGAETVRDVLEELDLPCYLQTSGSRGLHVVTPLRQEHGFDEVGDFAERVALEIVRRDPDAFTVEFHKKERGDRLLIDHFRNRYAQTAVVPYSVRAKAGAPVAMPIDWDELKGLDRGAGSFTVASAPARLRRRPDAWKGIGRRARSLKRARSKLERF